MPRCGGGGDRVVCYERLVATTADEVNKRLADTMAACTRGVAKSE